MTSPCTSSVGVRMQEERQGVECQSSETPRAPPGADPREMDTPSTQSPPLDAGVPRRGRRGICAFFRRARKFFRRSGEPAPVPAPSPPQAEPEPVPGPSGLQSSANAVAAVAEHSDTAVPDDGARRGVPRRGRRGVCGFFRRARKFFRRSGEPAPVPAPTPPQAEPEPVPGPSGLQRSANAVAAGAERSVAVPDDNRVSQVVSRRGRRQIFAFFRREIRVFWRSREPETKPVPGPSGLQSSESTASATAVSDYEPSRENFKDIYAFQKILANGSFGVVRLATRGSDWLEVAVKCVSNPPADSYIFVPDHPKPLYGEMALLVMLRRPPVCPYVIKMLDWFDMGGSLSIVMEYPESCMSLKEFIRRKIGIPISNGYIIMRQLIKAVQFCLHRRVFHNDINLQNILVYVKPVPKIKLIGFNSARLLDEDGYDASTYNGDPRYMPPEVFAMRKYHAVPTSVWFMGIIFYAILKGQLPFHSIQEIFFGPIQYLPLMSSRCEYLLRTCLSRRADMRPTLEELLEH